MKAIVASEYGGPEVLKLEDVPPPEPGANEVLIRMRAAGVNPADWKYRTGMYKQVMPLQFPWTPGLDGAGVVEKVGQGVRAFRTGQEVYGIVSRSYAEYGLAKEQDIQPKPVGLTFEQAASVPVGALTAWSAVVIVGQVEPNQRVLVQGGAGGVGLYAVQLAKWAGAHVSATASAGNLDYLRSIGAEKAIDYNAAPFEDVVHDMDVVIDTVGGELMQRSFKVLREGGLYVTVVGRVPEGAGKAEGVNAKSAGRAPNELLREVSKLIEAGVLQPEVGPVFPLLDADGAQALSEGRHGRGRIVLRIPA